MADYFWQQHINDSLICSYAGSSKANKKDARAIEKVKELPKSRKVTRKRKAEGNVVSTTKYDLFSFLPKGLYEQVWNVPQCVTYRKSKPNQYEPILSLLKFFKVGVLIGKAGDTIRTLQNSSRAGIQITRDAKADPHYCTETLLEDLEMDVSESEPRTETEPDSESESGDADVELAEDGTQPQFDSVEAFS
ncbi:far upstream element-binding protein 1 [Tanacetum coccineum]